MHSLAREGHNSLGTRRCRLTSEVKLQSRVKRSLARQLRIERQRFETIILVGDVKHADSGFRRTMPEAVADKCIQLPEVVSRFLRNKATVVLTGPKALHLGEESAAMMIEGVQGELVQGRLLVAIEGSGVSDARWNVGEPSVEIAVRQLVPRAQRPLFAQELIQRYGQRFFREVEILARAGSAVRDRDSRRIRQHAHRSCAIRGQNLALDAEIGFRFERVIKAQAVSVKASGENKLDG